MRRIHFSEMDSDLRAVWNQIEKDLGVIDPPQLKKQHFRAELQITSDETLSLRVSESGMKMTFSKTGFGFVLRWGQNPPLIENCLLGVAYRLAKFVGQKAKETAEESAEEAVAVA
jgi:hypothetical protein